MSLPGRFVGKTAVVTGAAQGIGLASAERIAAEGGRLVIADQAGEAAEAVAEVLRQRGAEAIAVAADLSEYANAVEVMSAAEHRFGSIQVLVNNVGGTIWKKPFWYYSEEEIRQEVKRSFWPPLWCARAVLPFMRRTGGAIVNIGSNAIDGVYRVPYSACKGAVAALTTALAAELVDLNIRVNGVAPGGTLVPERKTPRQPRPLSTEELEWEHQFMQMIGDEDLLGRFATIEEQAAAVAFLASDEASHISGEMLATGRRGRSIGKVLGFIP